MNSQLSFTFDATPVPEELFLRVYRRLRHGSTAIRFKVTFRQWAQLRSAIRGRDGAFEVEICDTLQNAPPIVIEALAEILIMRYHRQKPSREARACYLAHVMAPATRERIDEARRVRGFKRIRPAQGSHLDLEEIFASLNQKLFNGKVEIQKIGWSPSASRTILGHYDPAHKTITISRALDRPRAPRLMVEYIVHHEMLHAVFPVERIAHRRVIHPAKFREAERRFPGYTDAQRLLKSEGWTHGWEGARAATKESTGRK
ncbi:MAG: SprT-like domain-containing protein [Terriglobia bacterium]